MTSRGRKDRGQAAGSEELQLWYGIRTHLKQLESIDTIFSAKAKELDVSETEVEKLSKRISDLERTGGSISSSGAEEPRKEYGLKRDLCLRLFAESKGRTIEEQVAIDGALEKIGILSALMSAPDSTSIDSNKRKKRRTDAASPAPSRSPSIQPPSASSNSSSVNEQKRSHTIHISTNRGDRTVPSSSSSSSTGKPEPSGQSSTSNPSNSHSSRATGNSTPTPSSKVNSGSHLNLHHQSSAPGTPSIRRSNTSGKDEINTAAHSSGSTSTPTGGSHTDLARTKKENLVSQLPLQKGRRVAFRQPVKKPLNGNAAAMAQMQDEDETWIMASVIECINNDKNRYVVQDDAPEDYNSGPLPTWNTTLKAIVPLPESINTIPERDYAPGSRVMGLYPDTSCFYRAIVKGGGPNMEQALKGNPAKLVKREQELLNSTYQLVFEDDNDEVRLVPAYLVVERPSGS